MTRGRHRRKRLWSGRPIDIFGMVLFFAVMAWGVGADRSLVYLLWLGVLVTGWWAVLR